MFILGAVYLFILYLATFIGAHNTIANIPAAVAVMVLLGLIAFIPDFLVPKFSNVPLKKRLWLALSILVTSEVATLLIIPITDWISIAILTGCNLCGAGIIALRGRLYTSLDY